MRRRRLPVRCFFPSCISFPSLPSMNSFPLSSFLLPTPPRPGFRPLFPLGVVDHHVACIVQAMTQSGNSKAIFMPVQLQGSRQARADTRTPITGASYSTGSATAGRAA
jgi:hypothetical protein